MNSLGLPRVLVSDTFRLVVSPELGGASTTSNGTDGRWPIAEEVEGVGVVHLRLQCITEMLETGVPEGVIPGHVDGAMTQLFPSAFGSQAGRCHA